MSDESAAVEQAPAEMPAPAEPIEGQVIPPAAPESARGEADDAETGRPEGIPAGHLAAGGLSASAVALGTLYQLLGLSGLIGGGMLAAGGGIAYARRRYSQRDRRTWGVSWEDGQPARGPGRRGRHSGGGDVLGGLRSEGRSFSRSGGRRSTGGDGNVGGTSAGRGGRRPGGGSSSTTSGHGAGGRGSAGGRSAGHSGPRSGRTGGSTRRGGPLQAVGQVATSTGRAARGTARAVRAGAGHARRAASWVDRKTDGRLSQAARAAASGARKAAVWADRKTGRRVSSAYQAATTGKAKGFRARRRRAAAVLGWHGPLTAPVIALMAVLAEWWRARKTRTAQTEDTETASEETSMASEDTTTPAEDDGDPALPCACDCPRCGRRNTATIPADEGEITITCPCGFTITFYRAPPDDPPDETEATQTRASTGSDRRRPHTAPTATIRRNTMSANPLAAAAAELNAVAAAHAPVDMWQVARELDQLPEVPANVGMALRTYTVRLQGEYPIHPAVVEALGELYIAHAQLVAAAESIGPLFRQVHAEDLRREEAPRINEQAWNV